MPELRYGAIRVPWTTSWTGELRFEIRDCPYAKARALWQPAAQGVGKPEFSKPHAVRQRQAMMQCRCDICGKRLATSTKVSLSQESPRHVDRIGWALLATEPLMHTACAAEELDACPVLRRQLRDGTLKARQVFRYRTVAQLLTADATEEFAHLREPGTVGHIKLQILDFEPMRVNWLERAA